MGATDRPLGAFPLGKYALGFRKPGTVRHEPYSFPPGSYTFIPPLAGYWKFVAWGPGFSTSGSGGGGDSGAYGEITKFLTPAARITISVGSANGLETASTITFPDGTVASAGPGTGVSGAGPGVASGFDFSISGNVSGGASGANGPSHGAYLGGSGVASGSGNSPGAGGSSGTASGGSGLVLAVFVRP